MTICWGFELRITLSSVIIISIHTSSRHCLEFRGKPHTDWEKVRLFLEMCYVNLREILRYFSEFNHFIPQLFNYYYFDLQWPKHAIKLT